MHVGESEEELATDLKMYRYISATFREVDVMEESGRE